VAKVRKEGIEIFIEEGGATELRYCGVIYYCKWRQLIRGSCLDPAELRGSDGQKELNVLLLLLRVYLGYLYTSSAVLLAFATLGFICMYLGWKVCCRLQRNRAT
jgi:hypothetical protein